MLGTRLSRRAVIALSFGVQAVLIAGDLSLPARPSSPAGLGTVRVLPIARPPGEGVTSPIIPFPVTVRVGAASTTMTYPDPGVQQLFLLRPGPDVTATVTVTLPPSGMVPGLSFTLGDKPSPQGGSPGSQPASRDLLDVPSLPAQGTLTFSLHLGSLAPGSDEVIVMTVTRQADSGMASGEIAEIVTS